MPETQAAKEIKITVKNHTYKMGSTIPLGVHYTNRGSTPLSFRDPEKTWEVSLEITATNQDKAERHFGRLFYHESEGRQRTTVEEAKEIKLNTGEVHSFNQNVGARWLEHFSPGTVELMVIDRVNDEATIASNRIKLKINFSDDSFLYLLSIIENPNCSLDAKYFAVEWISKFYTPFKIHIEEPTQPELKENYMSVQNARNWWQSNRSTLEVLQKIKDINQG